MKYPMNGCGLLSCNDHEWDVGRSTLFFMSPALVRFFLKSFFVAADWNGIYSCTWVYLHLYGFCSLFSDDL